MKWIYTKLTQIIISSEIIVYLIVRILFYKSPKIHLIHLVIVFLLFYQYSHNYYFYDHGMYNIIVFIFVLINHILVTILQSWTRAKKCFMTSKIEELYDERVKQIEDESTYKDNANIEPQIELINI